MKILIGLLLSFNIILTSCTGLGGNKNTGTSPADSLVLEDIFPYQALHCHGSSVAELPNRDLLAVWFYGSGERTADDVVIQDSRRNHLTGKWSEPFVMADVPGFPDINPVVFIDQQSRLWLVWYTVLAYQWESSVLKYRISENYMQESGAPVWKWQDVIHVKPDGSTPDGIGSNDSYVSMLLKKYEELAVYLDSAGYFSDVQSGFSRETFNIALERYMERARGTNLISSGTDVNEKGEKVRTQLGYPLMRRIGWQTRNKPLFAGKRMLLPLYSDGFDFSMVAYTDDGGITWNFSEPLVGAGPVQPSLLLCNDSSIVAYMRDNGPAPQRLMKSISHDLGITWSIARDSDIPNPGSGADVVRLQSGNWVLAENDLEDGRYRLSVWLSEDEGKTWPFKKVIKEGLPDSDTRAHYPAIIQGSDGLIHVSFTNQVPGPAGQPSVKNIAHAVFSEAWIMN